MNNSPRNTICNFKWTWPIFSIARTDYRLCCKTPLRPIDMSSENSFINSDYEKQRRLEMLQGIRHNDCIDCWKVEDTGALSFRKTEGSKPSFEERFSRQLIEEFGTTDLDEVAKVVNIDSKILESNEPSNLELALNNTCDLQCIYCHNTRSSQWALDDLKNKVISFERYKAVTQKITETEFTEKLWNWIENFAKNHLTWISIVGGEPSITPEFYLHMDRLLEVYKDGPHKKAELWIITNMHTPPAYFDKFISCLEKLSKVFRLCIGISTESVYERAEFMRSNLTWNKFESNIDRLLRTDIEFHEIKLYASINALSVPGTLEFLKWHNKLNTLHNKEITITTNIVTFPDSLSPFILPGNFATYIREAINYFADTPYANKKFKSDYLNFLKGIETGITQDKFVSTERLTQFYNQVSATASRTKLDFAEIFPEINDFYKYCGTL